MKKKNSPINELVKELKRDKGYYIAWQANIAMAFKDNYHWYRSKMKKRCLSYNDIHIIANKAADCFLQLLMS